MLFFIAVLSTYVIANFGIPILIRGKGKNATEERGKDAVEFYYSILDNELYVLIIGLVVGVILVTITSGLRDKPTIVGLTIENETFIVKTRNTKLNTLKDHTGDLKDLSIVRTKMKMHAIESANICYKFYRQKDFLGMFIPDHFVWADIPKIQIINVLKILKPTIKDKL